MTVLSIFIATAVSVAVAFLFRTLDRDNNSMEKITRYAKKCMADFDEYFEKAEKKLVGLSADLQTKQTLAAAAVKRLEQQREEFERGSGAFGEQFAAVESIGRQLESYRSVINELMDMTGRVEENLEHVRKESGVIDSLTAAISAQKKTVDAIEKKIPQINEQFTERNNESLKTISTALLNQYQSRAEQIDRATAAAAERSEKTLKKMEEDVRRVFDEAAQRAARLDDAAFKRLAEQIQGRNGKFAEDFATRAKDLEAQMQAKISELTDHLRAETDAIKKQFGDALAQAKSIAKELNAEVSGNGKTLESLRTSLEKQTGEVQSRFSQLYEQAIADADEKERAAYTKFQKISADHVLGYKNLVEEQIKAMQESVDSAIGGIDADVKQKIGAVQDDVSAKVAGLQGSLQAAERAKSDLETFQKQADEQIAAVNEKLAQLTERLSTVYDTKQTELLSLVDSQLDGYRKNLDYRFGRLEKIEADVGSLEDTLKQQLEQTRGRVISEFAAFTAAQAQAQEDFVRTVKANSDDIAKQVARLESQLNDMQTTASDDMSAKLRAFEEQFSADLRQRGERIDGELAAWKQGHDEKLSSLAEGFEQSRQEIETKHADEIKAAFADQEAQVQAKVAELSEQLRAETETVKTQFKETLAQAHETAGALKAELDGNGETLQSLRTSLESQMADIQTRYNQLYEQAVADADAKEREAYARLQGNAAEYLAKYKNDIEEKIKAMQSAVDAEISTADTSLKDKIGAVRGEVDETVAGLQGSLQAAQQAKSDLETFQKQADEQMGEVREKLTRLKEQLSAVCDERQTELLAQVESQFSGYREHLDYRFKTLERIGADVDALEENLRHTLELTKGSVMGEFAAFTAEQERKRADFEQGFKTDSDSLAGKIALLEGQLSDIQVSASDNMSAKLKEFEANFSADLQQRGARIDGELDAWKQRHDERLASLADDLERGQRDFAARHADDLKTAIADQQARAQADIAGLSEQMRAEAEAVRNQFSETLAQAHETADALRAELDSNGETLKTLRASVENQMDEVQEKLTQLKERLSAVCDERQTELLAQVESQFSNYREHLDYRFKKLEHIGADVDAFEQNLRHTLELTKGSVMGEFTAFTAEQEQKRADFERDFRTGSDELARGLAQLEDQLNELKETASENVSATLQVFEEKFSADLQRRSSRIDDELNTWKRDLDERIDTLAGDFETDRRSLEERYTDDLRTNLADQQARAQADIADFTERLRTETESLANRLGETLAQATQMAHELEAEQNGNGETLKTLRASLESQIADLQARYDQLYRDAVANAMAKEGETYARVQDFVAQQLDGYKNEVEAKISAMQGDVSASISTVDEELKERLSEVQGDMKTTIGIIDSELRSRIDKVQDSAEADINAIDAEVRQRIDTMQDGVDTAIDTIDAEMKQRIGTMQSGMDSAISTIDADVKQKIGTVQGDVHSVIDTFGTEMKEKVGAIQGDMSTAISALDADVKERIGTIQNNVRSVVSTLDTQVRQKIDAVQGDVSTAISTFDAQLSDKISAVQDEVNSRVASLQESLQTAARTKADLQAFQSQMDVQVAAVRDNLAQLREEVSAVYGAKQEELLTSMETQIDKYRENLEYRLRQLEKTEADIGVLEENLRQSLAQAEARVTDTFAAYTAAQEQRQADFAQRVKDKNDDIAGQIALLASQVNELKATARDNVSATLKDFEENFDMDLRRRSEDIEERLNAWKQRLDSELIALTGDYEEKRRVLEAKYLEGLRERVSGLEAQGREQTQRYETGLATTLDGIKRRVADTEQTVGAFMEKANIDLQSVTDNFNRLIETNFTSYGQRIDEVIAKAQQETEERLAAIAQTVHEHEDTHKSNIDTMRGDLQAWQKLLKSQFDDSKELIIKQLSSLHDASNQRINEVKAEFDKELAAFKNSAHGKQVEISAGMDVLQKQIAAALADYETRSAQHLDELQKQYDGMLQETKRLVDEQTGSSEKTLRDLREQIQKFSNDTDKFESDMTMRMQNDAADLQTRFSEIDQQVKAFAAQMQVYQTADKLQAKLDSEISKLNNELAKVDTYRPSVERLLSSFSQLQGMNEDASNKLARFEAKKAHIDTLERKFDTLVTLSDRMDEKIRELHTTSDDLQEVQIAVRKFQDTLGDISTQYDRLEKKQEVIGQVTADVDKSFDNLKELERRLDDAVRQSGTIPEALKDIQRDIDVLMANADKVNDAVDKIDSIKAALSETEQRIQQVQTARTGIAGVETRLQNLDKEIERKMGVLLRATQADLEKNPGQVAHSITPQDREAIVQLKRQGWTVDEIARRMHRSVSEVELILEMPSD